ncbi:hypothetical protein DDB_G0280723 [Dictyostelium discoideum AX4]|uniref:Uncharacterized protein n=1 Tax=Dictyostelium discoideum TaxID=44689 RepID=Q54UY4_DICDI|nr:hypothetical protein DDB_G0280723 [Dictyostelium discoideum AX4]EAL67163.1 hypothetical protein DDB_G0280723 [Dictyostelium discoideum AX4]|eukprot:XP_641147.1 hypothetical protein DDB_G0280723 [Dictyostelium discoideum AX4]
MNLFWNIAPVHKDDPVFIQKLLYSRDYYNLFVSHLRTNSVIHFDIESNYENHFLKNIRNNDDYNQNNEDGSDGEWDGESEDSSDDSDNYDDTHQGENHVEEEEEEELEREQAFIKNSCRTGCWECPVCGIDGGPFNLIIDFQPENTTTNITNLQTTPPPIVSMMLRLVLSKMSPLSRCQDAGDIDDI